MSVATIFETTVFEKYVLRNNFVFAYVKFNCYYNICCIQRFEREELYIQTLKRRNLAQAIK
jgi:hypothetical protein